MPGFMITTVGCKVNQYESQAVSALLEALGLRPAAGGRRDGVDVVAVNTCCVTATACAKSRRAIRRAVRRHPDARVLILGCYAAADAQLLRRVARQAGARGSVHLAGHDDDVAACVRRCAALPGGGKARPAGQPSAALDGATAPSASSEKPSSGGPSGVVTPAPTPAGLSRNDELMSATIVRSPEQARAPCLNSTYIRPHGGGRVKGNLGTAGLGAIESFAGRQRAFVKVQDGCDRFCTYCIVPHLRRRVWSREAGEVVAEAAALAAAGHGEVVLCGISLGAYGQPTTDQAGWTAGAALPGLLRRVAAVAGLRRVRLSSLHPADVTDELLAAVADCPNVAPHLHLPLLSGSERILRRMNRPYAPADFLRAVERLRRAVERPAVTTDVIVGFPGEGEQDFAETLELARKVGFSRVHVFPFSPRRGTPAWKWRAEAPPRDVVTARCRRLAELAGESAAAFRRGFLGRTVEVLVEMPNRATPPGRARGLTGRYVEVTFAPAGGESGDLLGQVVPVRVTGLSETGLTGQVADGGAARR